ncbi:MAG: sugar phosphate nucleotidyltransferase, partial [Rhizomicrobium sp.]
MPAPVFVPVILSGGAGTRLWPLSRQSLPKQFLHFFEGGSLIQQT